MVYSFMHVRVMSCSCTYALTTLTHGRLNHSFRLPHLEDWCLFACARLYGVACVRLGQGMRASQTRAGVVRVNC